MLFVVGAVGGLYLRDYVQGSEQRDAAFESFAHSFAAFVESQLAGSAHGVAIVAVMMFENVGGEFFGRFAGEVCVLRRLGVVICDCSRAMGGIAGAAGEIFFEPAEESTATAKQKNSMETRTNVRRCDWRAKNEATHWRTLFMAWCFLFMLPRFLSSASTIISI
jgi:hypothetical protein